MSQEQQIVGVRHAAHAWTGASGDITLQVL
jgi:hypothetical protein